MADTPTTVALINASLATIFEKVVAPQINRSGVLLQMLPKIPAWGKSVAWNMSFGNVFETTAPIADGADVTNFNRDEVVPATLSFTTYHDAFAMNGLAQAIARIAGNPEDLSQLDAYEFKRSFQRLGAAIATHIYNGTGANNQLMGLIDATSGGIIDTGTYAGVDRSTYPQAAGNVVDAANGDVTVTQMRSLNTKIKKASATGKPASVILASPIAFDKYVAQFDPNRTYPSDVFVNGKTITLDAGVGQSRFDNVPVICDVRIPETTTGSMLFLNLDEVAMNYIPMPSARDIQTGQVQLSPEGQLMSTNTGITGKIVKLATTGDKDKYAIYTYLQLYVRSCNAHGWIKNINISQ